MSAEESRRHDAGHRRAALRCGRARALPASAHSPGLRAPLEVRQFRGGQSNPTFLLRDGDGAHYVLRKQPGGPLLPSAHAVDREFRVISALHGTGFPVAPPAVLLRRPRRHRHALLRHGLRRRAQLLGRDAAAADARCSARRSTTEMNRVLVQLHTLDFAAIGLGDYGKPGNYFARQIGALEQAVPRLRDRADRGDGETARLAAGQHPRRR